MANLAPVLMGEVTREELRAAAIVVSRLAADSTSTSFYAEIQAAARVLAFMVIRLEAMDG